MGLLTARDRAHIRLNPAYLTVNQAPDLYRARYIKVNGILRFTRLTIADAIKRWAQLQLDRGEYAVMTYGDGTIIDSRRG